MPKVLRSSLYATPDRQAPVTMVTRESDIRGSVEAAAEAIERGPWGFVTTEIFEVDEATAANFIKTTMIAAARLDTRQETEWAMALSYFWNRDQLASLNPRGALVNPGRAPLTVGEVEKVILALTRSYTYRQQMITMRASDDTIVTFRDGSFVETRG